MSEFDEMDFDEDELGEMYENDPDDLSPEEVFKMVTINRVRKKRVSVELEDEEGDIVATADVVQELLAYIKDKMSDEEENQFTSQILPLMAQVSASGLGRFLGIRTAAFYLSENVSRTAIIHMMCVALLLLKFVQQKGLSITTFEEDVSDEEIDEIDRKANANSAATLAALAGRDPRAVLDSLREQGHLSDDDLRDILNDEGDGNDEDGEDNDDGSE